jgi:hypothetical protein
MLNERSGRATKSIAVVGVKVGRQTTAALITEKVAQSRKFALRKASETEREREREIGEYLIASGSLSLLQFVRDEVNQQSLRLDARYLQMARLPCELRSIM